MFVFFFFKQKTAYEVLRSLVGSEMCIRDREMAMAGCPDKIIYLPFKEHGKCLVDRENLMVRVDYHGCKRKTVKNHSKVFFTFPNLFQVVFATGYIMNNAGNTINRVQAVINRCQGYFVLPPALLR